MTRAALSSSGGLKRPTKRVGRMKSSTSLFDIPIRINRSCAVILSYAAKVRSSLSISRIAKRSPIIDALSSSGSRSNKGNVARTCPSGEGKVGKFDAEKTGAVASNPNGE